MIKKTHVDDLLLELSAEEVYRELSKKTMV